MKWYQSIYVKAGGIVAGLAVFGTLIGYVITAVNWWEQQKELPAKVLKLEQELDAIKKGDQTIYDYIESKSKSYAVGHRVKKVYDEEKGKWIKVKQYRDWEGVFHDVYIDLELSDFYGWDQYYYIDSETHEKIYV